MNKYVIAVVVSLLVGLGFGYVLPHGATPVKEQVLGGVYEVNPQHFANGVYAGQTDQYSIDSSGNVVTTGTLTTGAHTVTGALSATSYRTAAVGNSSSSPAVLGSAAAGHFVVAAGATTASASTTAVTANSDIQLSLEATTPIAGTTCNAAVNASSTPSVTTKVAANGFTVTIASAPVTNPFCYSYSITN